MKRKKNKIKLKIPVDLRLMKVQLFLEAVLGVILVLVLV